MTNTSMFSIFSSKGGDGLDASHITTSGNTMMSQEMNARLHNLVRRFNSRTEHHKERTIQPPTPSTTDSVASKSGKAVFVWVCVCVCVCCRKVRT